ncbi:MAG: ribonuclease PH [Anaerolineales bacterium]|jgi:ribonuclease PH
MDAARRQGRKHNELRPLGAEMDFITYPEGSVLFSMGATRVLCNASIEQGVPGWMQQQNKPGGWVTAEYAMLPRATHTRSQREVIKPRARSQEIRRLIGRSLRAAVKLEKLPEITCIVDCDVLQADGGTRTASISGGYMALILALHRFVEQNEVDADIFQPAVAAVSAGVIGGKRRVDLDYGEDSSADFDLNVVMNAQKAIIEVQGTAESGVINQSQLVELLTLSYDAIEVIMDFQREKLSTAGVELSELVWGSG